MPTSWLPADRLTSKPIKDIAPGQLVILPPVASEGACQLGIRFLRENRLPVFALTPFSGLGPHQPSDAVELAHQEGPFLTLNASLMFEADLMAPARRPPKHEFKPGDLVMCRSGPAIVTYLDRHFAGHLFIRPIDLASWTLLPNEDLCTVIFGAWRLRITIPGLDEPIYWDPGTYVS